jgi:hypothetical protein
MEADASRRRLFWSQTHFLFNAGLRRRNRCSQQRYMQEGIPNLHCNNFLYDMRCISQAALLIWSVCLVQPCTKYACAVRSFLSLKNENCTFDGCHLQCYHLRVTGKVKVKLSLCLTN